MDYGLLLYFYDTQGYVADLQLWLKHMKVTSYADDFKTFFVSNVFMLPKLNTPI